MALIWADVTLVRIRWPMRVSLVIGEFLPQYRWERYL